MHYIVSALRGDQNKHVETEDTGTGHSINIINLLQRITAQGDKKLLTLAYYGASLLPLHVLA